MGGYDHSFWHLRIGLRMKTGRISKGKHLMTRIDLVWLQGVTGMKGMENKGWERMIEIE